VKALIVEDDPQTLEAILLIFKLRWPELEPLSTSQGSEAALIVEKEAPDIVILDLGLPDMSGLEALKEIRAFSDVPLVIITARDDPTSHIKGLELGADDYITKPFDPGILLARIKMSSLMLELRIIRLLTRLSAAVWSFTLIPAKHLSKGASLTLPPPNINYSATWLKMREEF